MLTQSAMLWMSMLLTLGAGDPHDKPEALQRMEQARRSIISGSITWQYERRAEPNDMQTYVSRYARNGDFLFERRGNPEGWVRFKVDENGNRVPYDRHPELFMRNADGWWEALEGRPIVARLWKLEGLSGKDMQGIGRRSEVLDIRNVGIAYSPRALWLDEGFAAVWGDTSHPVTRWRQWEENGRVFVVGESEVGTTVRWEIDPKKGWNAESVEIEQNGVKAGARCRLKQYGDTWLPETTEYVVAGEVVEVVRILDAQVNRKSDPGVFTPAHLGLEPGAEVSHRNFTPENTRYLVWNGDGLSPREQWDADVKAGRRDWGPAGKHMSQFGYLDSPYDTPEQAERNRTMGRRVRARAEAHRYQRLWQQYVETFIKKYELGNDQQKQAWAIHGDCERLAKEHMARRYAAFNELTTLLQELRSAPRRDVERIEKAEGELRKLEEPIDKLFAEELVPRLDKLPTRDQRNKAAQQEKSPSSAPSPR